MLFLSSIEVTVNRISRALERFLFVKTDLLAIKYWLSFRQNPISKLDKRSIPLFTIQSYEDSYPCCRYWFQVGQSVAKATHDPEKREEHHATANRKSHEAFRCR